MNSITVLRVFGVVFFSLFVLEACEQQIIIVQRDGLSSPPNLCFSEKVKGTSKHCNKIQCTVLYNHTLT